MAPTVGSMTWNASLPPRCRVPRRPGAAAPLLLVLAVLAAACIPGAGAPAPTGPEGPTGGAGADAAATPPDGSLPVCRDPASLPIGGRELEPDRADGAAADPGPFVIVQLDAAGLIDLIAADAVAADGTRCVDEVVLSGAGDRLGRGLATASAVMRGLTLIITSDADGSDVDGSGVDGTDAAALGDGLRALLSDPLVDGPAALVRGHIPVLVVADDLAAQLDVAAQAAAGIVPVVVDPDATDADAAALLGLLGSAGRPADGGTAGPAGGAAGGTVGGPVDGVSSVRWAASTEAHARILEGALADLADVGIEATRWTPAAPAQPISELWLGDVRSIGTALMAAAMASRRGAVSIAVDGDDLRAGVDRTARIRAAVAQLEPGGRIVLVGAIGEATRWQLDTVTRGTPLPGGGFLPLEDRRIVALYGSPGTSALGMLGEQDDVATIARAREVAARYADAADGRIVVAGLDVIATIASSAAEPTGDFSRRVPLERLRPLVDLARTDGTAVFLDLQPGRTSFLDQAQEYEELLREPHVHLALDPEWRLGPQDRHLVRIGSVAAEEVQAVADWLAALVRRERLPQKVLMLHQFTAAMLPERDTIEMPVELIGVVHIDGQGPLPMKNRTYAALTSGAEERWVWGWKNFTRIDTPVATPEQTLDRMPIPLVVTYQ